MKSPLKLVSVLLMVAVIASLVSACGGGTTPPTTSPTATTTPATTPPATTLTTTPTTATPTTTKPPTTTTTPATTLPAETPKTYSFDAEIFGEKIAVATDAKGAMLDALEKTSPDGVITMKLEKGTKLNDTNFVPIKTFSASITTDTVTQPTDGSKIIGPTVVLRSNTSSTHITPPMTYRFKYGSFDAQIAAVTSANLTLGFIMSTGNWATFYVSSTDTASKVVTGEVDSISGNYVIALLAQPPKVVVKATEGPKNGVDISIVSGLDTFTPGGHEILVAKTVPNARVIIWVVNPKTGTRSAYPADHLKTADAEGNVTWDFNVSTQTARGDGHLEFYITTTTDPNVLAAFNSYASAGSTALETYFKDKAGDIYFFKRGEREMVELDDHTTLRMFIVTFK